MPSHSQIDRAALRQQNRLRSLLRRNGRDRRQRGRERGCSTPAAPTRNGQTSSRPTSPMTARRSSSTIFTSTTSKSASNRSARRFRRRQHRVRLDVRTRVATLRPRRRQRRALAARRLCDRAPSNRRGDSQRRIVGKRFVLHQRGHPRRQHHRDGRVSDTALPDVRRRGEAGDAARRRHVHGQIHAGKKSRRPLDS